MGLEMVAPAYPVSHHRLCATAARETPLYRMAAVLLCAGLYTAATLCPLFGAMHATFYLSDVPTLLATASFIRARSSMPQQLRAGHAATETATGRTHYDAHWAVKGARCRLRVHRELRFR
jgi:hypothetical protein